MLVEGWNVGWEDWFGNWKEDVFDFVTPYPDFDQPALEKYAAEKGVKIINAPRNLVVGHELRAADGRRPIAFMKAHGYDSVKTGYVGRIIPRGEHHDGQWMVGPLTFESPRHDRHVNKLMLDVPTNRCVPRACIAPTRIGLRANRRAAMSITPGAWAIRPSMKRFLPFTRLMGGPMDYTPGIFQIKLDYLSARQDRAGAYDAGQAACACM